MLVNLYNANTEFEKGKTLKNLSHNLLQVTLIFSSILNLNDMAGIRFLKTFMYNQRRIQTTSTYANAEVTSSVVKLLKNTGIPIFSTKLLSSFLLPIEKIRSLRPRVGRGYSAAVAERLCLYAMQ